MKAQPRVSDSKISVAVDSKSNSLVVIATPQDFAEVQALVQALDQSSMITEETIVTYAPNGSVNPDVLKTALESILGNSGQVDERLLEQFVLMHPVRPRPAATPRARRTSSSGSKPFEHGWGPAVDPVLLAVVASEVSVAVAVPVAVVAFVVAAAVPGRRWRRGSSRRRRTLRLLDRRTDR